MGGIGHAHKNQMVHTRRFSRIDSGAALCKLPLRAFASGAEKIGNHEYLFSAACHKCLAQVIGLGVIAHHGLNALRT